MKEVITAQLQFVLATLCSGMLLMLGYDVIRLFRVLIRHKKVWKVIEDIFYWMLAAYPVFVVFYIYNAGELRWYGVLGLLAGALLYLRGISLPLRKKAMKLAKMIARLHQRKYNNNTIPLSGKPYKHRLLRNLRRKRI